MNEVDLQKKINAELRSFGIKFFHIEAGRGHGAKYQHRKGLPDLLIFKGNGQVFFVELKAEGKKLKLEQVEFKAWCYRNGYDYYLVDNLRKWEAVKLLEGLK